MSALGFLEAAADEIIQMNVRPAVTASGRRCDADSRG